MIHLPEHEDDIYINTMIKLAVQNRDKELAFDLDAFREIEAVVMPVLRDRLGVLFEDNTTNMDQINLAEELFSKGFACEHGIYCPQDIEKSRHYYEMAAVRGSVEAIYRIGWLIESNPNSDDFNSTAEAYYKIAASRGHVRSLIALGQMALFRASKLEDFIKSREYFSKANKIDPNTDYLYIDAIDDMINSANSGQDIEVSEHLEHIAGLGSHLKKSYSPYYQKGIESKMRLVKFLLKIKVIQSFESNQSTKILQLK